MTTASLPKLQRCILRAGTVEPHLLTKELCADWTYLKAQTGCELFDLVRLPDDWIMLVDDEGLLRQRPINGPATLLYRSVCRPGMQDGVIVGDVALVRDGDFE